MAPGRGHLIGVDVPVDPTPPGDRRFDLGNVGDAHLEELLEPRVLKQVLARLQKVAGATGVTPGRTVPTVVANVDALARLLPAAMVAAAGLDRATTPVPAPPLLWDDGTNQLLVHITDATVRVGAGFIDVVVPVACDQAQGAQVVCTFLTATPDRPGGVVWATEDRPRGPAVIVNRWGDALVALCWRAALELVRVVSVAQGTDTFDRPLVASTVVATADGLAVTAMGAHRFMTPGTSGTVGTPGTLGTP